MSPDGSQNPPPPPEEKLLRLIRGKTGAPASGGARPSRPPAALAAAASASAARPARRASRPWHPPAWLWVTINAALALAALLGAVLILWSILVPVPQLSVATIVPASSADLLAEPTTRSAEPPASIAMSAMRPLFVTRASEAAPPGERTIASPSAQASALVGRLSLIGVVDGEPPQAIIEDTQNQKTYFVTAGQGFIEGLVVESILSNRVILNLGGGETLELSL